MNFNIDFDFSSLNFVAMVSLRDVSQMQGNNKSLV